ncbi:MAG TPA: hypothetical protein VFP55_05960 [Solirubrobacteraceae bacterium]|nr:hypothetical protein [Solirubrobacteraceae bacterium]
MNVAESPVSPTEQVRHESDVRMRYAGVALVAGVLLVVQAVIQYTGPHTNVSELTLDLITAHRRFPLDLIGAVLDCLGLIALAVMLVWLHSISRARNPEIRDFIRWLTLSGAVLSGVMAVIYAVLISVKASQFVSHGNQSYVEANALTSGGLLTVLPILAQLGSLLLTAGFIWTTLNATRIGLLTRFVGYLGAFAGLLVLFPIGSPVPVVQGFWLLSMAIIIAGRWPSGNPPAWESGAAVPWTPISQPRERPQQKKPSPRQQRASRRELAQSAARASAKEAASAEASPSTADGAQSGRTRASTPKRKRKRRN